MGILGLTHDESGAALDKLPVTVKVAIGEAPGPGTGNTHPRRLDHFVFKRKTLHGQNVVWEPAPDICNAHGEKPTSLGIIFLNDDPREVFQSGYALWTPSGCRCHGELVQIANGGEHHYEMRATRRTLNHPEGEDWPGNYRYVDGPKKGQPVEPCGDGCPDLERGDCKPSGDLHFILEKFPTFGAICRLHTSSYRSIRNLSNGLMQIRRLNGERLSGIKTILKASPERISYSDRDGVRRTTVAYILSLELGGTDLRTLVASMTEPARLLSEVRQPLEFSHRIRNVVHEPEEDRAEEIASEFYPASESGAAESFRPGDGQSESGEQLARICEFARRLGFNEAKTRMLIGQSTHDLAGLERRLLNRLDEPPGSTQTESKSCEEQRIKSETRQGGEAATSTQACPTMPRDAIPFGEGFLF